MAWLHRLLFQPFRPLSRLFHGLLVLVILLSVALLPFEIWGSAQQWPLVQTFERLALGLFTVEYVLRILSARDRLRYIFSWWGLIDFLAVVPFYLPLVGVDLIPPVFAPLRILRIAKFARLYGGSEVTSADRAAAVEGHVYAPLPGERLLAVVQHHPVVFYRGMGVVLLCMMAAIYMWWALPGSLWGHIFAACFGVSALIFFWGHWLDYNHDLLFLTSERLIVQNRELFGTWRQSELWATLGKVTAEKAGFWGWVFGYGTLKINSATQGVTRLRVIPHAESVAQEIYHFRTGA
ncbi:ion transporter [Candidatus Peribacteria bacterium]|nr:ion transporter [Candidatus Peribacteria bacterium]